MSGYKAPEKVVTIQGEDYKGLNIAGNAYAPVPQRIESAHKNGGFSMVRCEWLEIFGVKCCEIEIERNGQHFIGTAEVNLGFGHPISDAQTSALGRALGEAGFDVQRAIASAEDMEHAANGHMHVIESDPPALPDPQMKQLLLASIAKANEAGLTGKPLVDHFIEWTGTPWNDLNRNPSAGDLEAIAIGLNEFVPAGS